ncbi:hypothetical protein PRZ48_010670 [Zasmidium cellare]|uniref:Uncharacterized protein n=1 Tax=Zasmidium cellare TaxID=395010 RepID=A0ABR0E9M5_ZASCE|nr:hypothetical protein PRZ48_010670 [Zasmidium cellare]
MDPNTATRQQFTRGLVDGPTPSHWPQPLKDRVVVLRSLLDKLGNHQAMATNLQQTYMTPANSKNKVYFMWDFVGRTLGYFSQLSDVTSVNSMNATQKELWGDVEGRCEMAANLILDTMPGMLNNMVEQSYPGTRNHPEFGNDIKEDARRLQAVV